MRKINFVTALAVGWACLASVPAMAADADVSDGEFFYSRSCAGCHGVDGGGYYPFAPALKGNAFIQNAPAGVIIDVIQHGRKYENKSYQEYSGMPAFVNIRGSEAEALVGYLKGGLQK